MRTTVSTRFATHKRVRKTSHNTAISLLMKLAAAVGIVLLTATPAIAEQPWPVHTVMQQNNIRRLRLLNECTGCNLEGVDLTDQHLIGADLRDANLRWANLSGSNFEGADFTGANLTGTNFTGAFLTNAVLADTQMVLVNFTDADLYSVDVSGAYMRSLDLSNANIVNTPISVGGPELSLPSLVPADQ